MRKKRIMIIGARGTGKTSLVNILNDKIESPKKSQDVIYGKNTIDIPSAYIENTWMYKHLIALSQDAYVIIILFDFNNNADIYSPNFTSAFTKPVIGVINKWTIDSDDSNICSIFEKIGVKKPYFKINTHTNEGIEELKEYLKINERG